MEIKNNYELLAEFESTLVELVESVNGLSRKSERNLSQKLDVLKQQILNRMIEK